jgi:hypothetical protein
VRNGYLQRREHSIRRAIRERNSETEWLLLRNLFSDDDTDVRTTSETAQDR